MTKTYEITGIMAIDYRSRDWCKLPYRDRPKGCKQYGRKQCPPNAPLVEDWIDLNKPHWFIVTEFDLSSHAKRMKMKHPKWSERQCENLYYWQNTCRKALREGIKEFQKEHPGIISTLIPEAMGVHVFRTARKLGIPIKPRPKDTVFKIALVGYSKNDNRRSLLSYL